MLNNILDNVDIKAVSYPLIWMNKTNKKIILTNHRVGTLSINEICSMTGYNKINNQFELKKNFPNEDDFKTYELYIFVVNPYSRMRSIYPGIMCYTKRDDIMNVNGYKSFMTVEEKEKFQQKRYSSKLCDWIYCLDLFIKYYDKYYQQNVNYEKNENKLILNRFDAHITPQSHPFVYDKSILELCSIIKLEEINTEKNKTILKKLFNKDKLTHKHRTEYLLDKKTLLTSKYIKFINRYYSEDFKIFNYDMIINN